MNDFDFFSLFTLSSPRLIRSLPRQFAMDPEDDRRLFSPDSSQILDYQTRTTGGLPLHELPDVALRRLTEFTEPNDNRALLQVNRSGFSPTFMQMVLYRLIENRFCQITVADDRLVALCPAAHTHAPDGSLSRVRGCEPATHRLWTLFCPRCTSTSRIIRRTSVASFDCACQARRVSISESKTREK